MTQAFEILKSEITYRGRVLDVRQDQVRLDNGSQVNLDVVVHRGAVTMVPVDADGQVWFVRQYRHAIEDDLLELPAGALEEGEPPANAAQREIREEIGMAAGRLEEIGTFYLAPGYSTEFMHVFLARELRPDPLEGDMDEVLSVEKFPISRVYEFVKAGEIRDAKSLAALFLARPYLMGDR
jgi:ADP-ribose pyrophosphatase